LEDGSQIKQTIYIPIFGRVFDHWGLRIVGQEITQCMQTVAMLVLRIRFSKCIETPAAICLGNMTQVHGFRITHAYDGCRVHAHADDIACSQVLVCSLRLDQ